MSLSGGQNQDKIVLSGIGIHSGKPASINIALANPGTGIVFVHNGLNIPALVNNVTDTRRGTAIGRIFVTEHFLSACYALNLFDLKIEVFGDELPTLDGSSLTYYQALKNLASGPGPLPINIMQTIRVQDKDAYIEAMPYNGFKVNFMINLKTIGEQKLSFDLNQDNYAVEIAPSRTFGFIEEMEQLKAQGLGLGASLDNALAIDKNGYVNQPRFKDEPVRHKILDLMGDLALLGQQVKAEITANRSGHKLNIYLVRRILEDAAA